MNFLGLFNGMVMETTVESWTGDYLYSDFATGKGQKDTTLNTLVKIPIIGILGGFFRVALGIIHTIGHLVAACLAVCLRRGAIGKGHLFHASKGICEVLRGGIESIPVIGRIFANLYASIPLYDPLGQGGRSWWMIKIYNPNKPDGLDFWMDNWQNFPAAFMIKA